MQIEPESLAFLALLLPDAATVEHPIGLRVNLVTRGLADLALLELLRRPSFGVPCVTPRMHRILARAWQAEAAL